MPFHEIKGASEIKPGISVESIGGTSMMDDNWSLKWPDRFSKDNKVSPLRLWDRSLLPGAFVESISFTGAHSSTPHTSASLSPPDIMKRNDRRCAPSSVSRTEFYQGKKSNLWLCPHPKPFPYTATEAATLQQKIYFCLDRKWHLLAGFDKKKKKSNFPNHPTACLTTIIRQFTEASEAGIPKIVLMKLCMGSRKIRSGERSSKRNQTNPETPLRDKCINTHRGQHLDVFGRTGYTLWDARNHS